MVVDYPGLRRRPPRGVEVDRTLMQQLPTGTGTATASSTTRRRWNASKIYCFISILVALVALGTGRSNSSQIAASQQQSSHVQQRQEPNFFQRLFMNKPPLPPPEPPKPQLPPWIRWIIPKNNNRDNSHQQQQQAPPQPPEMMLFWTDLLDSILTSTPRLLIMANLLLSVTYWVHTAVANAFLDVPAASRESFGRERLGGFLVFKLLLISAVVTPDTLDLVILLAWYTLLSFLRSLAGLAAATTAHTSQSGQPPKAGVLPLLLAVLMCDFCAAATCVALFHGAGYHMIFLLTCDCALLAVDVMVHLFRHLAQKMDLKHSVMISQLEARQLALHSPAIRRNAESSGTATSTATNTSSGEGISSLDDNASVTEGEEATATTTIPNTSSTIDAHGNNISNSTVVAVMEESRQLDQRMERMEGQHNRSLAILETVVYLLQLLGYTITVGHFIHIWTLHGLQFTLIDGVLALHLHSTLSAAGKKIAERSNLNRIARDLDQMFDNATELELSKLAQHSGSSSSAPNSNTPSDLICCICLGTMSTGSVKKVACGHLYHTHCLREVVERARSMEAAKCPLCRASVLSGEREGDATANNNNNNNNNGGEDDPNNAPNNEYALFRFSTEGILPPWLPIPAFSFEVVRRPAAALETTTPNNIATATETNRNQDDAADSSTAEVRLQGTANADHSARPTSNIGVITISTGISSLIYLLSSMLRQILLLIGLFGHMTPQEEAAALEQLVDMFPQYDRADLLRELRLRATPEGVVESVLQGTFTGVVRGGNTPNTTTTSTTSTNIGAATIGSTASEQDAGTSTSSLGAPGDANVQDQGIEEEDTATHIGNSTPTHEYDECSSSGPADEACNGVVVVSHMEGKSTNNTINGDDSLNTTCGAADVSDAFKTAGRSSTVTEKRKVNDKCSTHETADVNDNTNLTADVAVNVTTVESDIKMEEQQ